MPECRKGMHLCIYQPILNIHMLLLLLLLVVVVGAAKVQRTNSRLHTTTHEPRRDCSLSRRFCSLALACVCEQNFVGLVFRGAKGASCFGASQPKANGEGTRRVARPSEGTAAWTPTGLDRLYSGGSSRKDDKRLRNLRMCADMLMRSAIK